jgi:Glycoside hydrolase 123, N-terminal domain
MKSQHKRLSRGYLAIMKYVVAFCFLSLSGLATAVEVDLFVTDYGQGPSADQQPLADRPLTYVNPQQVTIKTANGERETYDKPLRVTVNRKGGANPREARIFASKGEYEPFSLLLRPKTALEQVFITSSDLTGDAGRIPKENVTICSIEDSTRIGRKILVKLGKKWNMPAYSTENFWCTVKVPDDARPGIYKGKLTVTAKNEAIGSISIMLEVLDIKLEEPPFALGLNYSNPHNQAALEAQLADMRRHGMTCVAPLYDWHLPVHDSNTAELGNFIESYKKAGFTKTLYFASPMNLQLSSLAGYGDETSKRWQQKYIQVMMLLHAEMLRHNVPVLMSIADELTNKGIEGVHIGGRLARFVWEELPEIAATSDMNGYMEVMAMAPHLNVAAFNNGWDGIDHHNKGRHLINGRFILEVQAKTGAIPWFVNAGVGRFPFGFFFWKMTKYGVKGKVEWYYNLNNGRGSLVRTEGATIQPTLEYERSREGIDDLKYLCTLEKLIARAKSLGKATAERRSAEALLERIADGIADDWTAYTQGGERFPADGMAVMSPEKTANMSELNALRRALADQIMRLQEALK